MKTNQENFWNYFQKVQTDLVIAYHSGNGSAFEKYFKKLENKLRKIDKGLSLIISFDVDQTNRLIISVNENKKNAHLKTTFTEDAPVLDNWEYQMGLQPYDKHPNPMSLHYSNFGIDIASNRIYVVINTIFKSSNKLHLHVFFDLNTKGIPKSELRWVARDFLNFYLGDKYFYKHISRIKIVKRKLKSVNFIPLSELHNLIEFKSLN